MIRHQLGDVDAVILPGGFSYGDYLRCGAIAKFSPVMQAVKKFAADGGLVLGICNGFQILVGSGLAARRAAAERGTEVRLQATSTLRIETTNSPFTQPAHKGQILRFPIAHGEGLLLRRRAHAGRAGSRRPRGVSLRRTIPMARCATSRASATRAAM